MHTLYIALSLSVVACSCVRTSRVLFVLPMYEELQPGHVNSYTTFDFLSGGGLSLVLVKKHILWSSVLFGCSHSGRRDIYEAYGDHIYQICLEVAGWPEFWRREFLM